MTDHQILFTGDMVKTIFNGSKTQTRRIVTLQDCYALRNGLDKKYSDVSLENAYSVNTKEYLRVPYRHKDDSDDWADCGAWRVDPKWEPGDRLLVRENIRTLVNSQRDPRWGYGEHLIEYLANKQLVKCPDELTEWWRKNWHKRPSTTIPSIHMPKRACRLWLDVLRVWAERLQEISDEDALKEGIGKQNRFGSWPYGGPKLAKYVKTPAESFMYLWDSINAKPKLCKHNPYTNAKEICYVGYPWEEIRTERTLPSGKMEYIIGNPMVWPIEFKRIKQ